MQRTIQRFLTKETLTFGDVESVDVERVEIAWDQNPPVILVVVRVADSNRPTFKEVSMVQEEINRRQPIRFNWWFSALRWMSLGLKKNPTKTALKRASC